MIGFGTYTFFWEGSELAPERLSVIGMIERTAEAGVELFQICDDVRIESMSDDELRRVADAARERGVALELGTKGIAVAHLERFLHIATVLGATLLRSMVTSGDDRPSAEEAEARLRQVLPAFEAAGVTIALETYEQLSSRELVDLVTTVDHPNLGICLDPANTVARLEHPADVIERTLPHVRNLHVKDFRFTRRGGWVGFTLEGAPLGTGLLDYPALAAAVRPDERGVNQIIEHWLPLGDSITETIELERTWTAHNLQYLREGRS
jgi:sugar phosphate isomerase/epimerase